ncbi:MAG: cytochrome c [Rhodospirillales bacterium]|nr:cytochrome c [Rhodospirillales bacterium]
MVQSGVRMLTGAAAAGALLVASTIAPGHGDEKVEQAIEARMGFMQAVTWEAGPLFGMARGDMAYDAEAAMDYANALNALVQYDAGRLFIEGSSRSEVPGETRSLMAIWEKPDDFARAYSDFQAAAAGVAAVAGDGQEALAAAVTALGKSCGTCHKPFRAEAF